MKTWTVMVTETYVSLAIVKAKTEEEALQLAEEQAVEGLTEDISCDRTCELWED